MKPALKFSTLLLASALWLGADARAAPVLLNDFKAHDDGVLSDLLFQVSKSDHGQLLVAFTTSSPFEFRNDTDEVIAAIDIFNLRLIGFDGNAVFLGGSSPNFPTVRFSDSNRYAHFTGANIADNGTFKVWGDELLLLVPADQCPPRSGRQCAEGDTFHNSLRFSYDAAPAPEPGSLSLLAAAGLALFAARGWARAQARFAGRKFDVAAG